MGLQSAPDRIRRHRMGRFAISLHDTDAWQIDYGIAALRLKRHAFPFGVSLRTRRESGMTSADYIWYLTTAARHFWSGTIRQQMQWYNYERQQPGDFEDAKREVSDLVTWMN